MSVSNGQKANQTTFNNAFASKTSDNTISGNNDFTGVVSLNNAGSAPAIGNVQTEINAKAPSNDSRFPTTQEKAALAGSAGAPSNTNRYITQEDTRLPSDPQDFTINNNEASAVATGFSFDESVSEVQVLRVALRRRTDSSEVINYYNIRASYYKDAAEWRSMGIESFSDNADAGVNFSITTSGDLEYTSDDLVGANYFGQAKIIDMLTFGVFTS